VLDSGSDVEDVARLAKGRFLRGVVSSRWWLVLVPRCPQAVRDDRDPLGAEKAAEFGAHLLPGRHPVTACPPAADVT
jgi:hypothetical protein